MREDAKKIGTLYLFACCLHVCGCVKSSAQWTYLGASEKVGRAKFGISLGETVFESTDRLLWNRCCFGVGFKLSMEISRSRLEMSISRPHGKLSAILFYSEWNIWKSCKWTARRKFRISTQPSDLAFWGWTVGWVEFSSSFTSHGFGCRIGFRKGVNWTFANLENSLSIVQFPLVFIPPNFLNPDSENFHTFPKIPGVFSGTLSADWQIRAAHWAGPLRRCPGAQLWEPRPVAKSTVGWSLAKTRMFIGK